MSGGGQSVHILLFQKSFTESLLSSLQKTFSAKTYFFLCWHHRRTYLRNPVFSLPHLPLWKKLPLSFQTMSWLDCLLFPSNVVYHPIEKSCPAPSTVFSLYLFRKNLLRTCQMNYFSAPMYAYILKLCESRQSRRSHEESSSNRIFL